MSALDFRALDFALAFGFGVRFAALGFDFERDAMSRPL
jgi:hypothetical protein